MQWCAAVGKCPGAAQNLSRLAVASISPCRCVQDESAEVSGHGRLAADPSGTGREATRLGRGPLRRLPSSQSFAELVRIGSERAEIRFRTWSC